MAATVQDIPGFVRMARLPRAAETAENAHPADAIPTNGGYRITS